MSQNNKITRLVRTRYNSIIHIKGFNESGKFIKFVSQDDLNYRYSHLIIEELDLSTDRANKLF